MLNVCCTPRHAACYYDCGTRSSLLSEHKCPPRGEVLLQPIATHTMPPIEDKARGNCVANSIAERGLVHLHHQYPHYIQYQQKQQQCIPAPVFHQHQQVLTYHQGPNHLVNPNSVTLKSDAAMALHPNPVFAPPVLRVHNPTMQTSSYPVYTIPAAPANALGFVPAPVPTLPIYLSPMPANIHYQMQMTVRYTTGACNNFYFN